MPTRVRVVADDQVPLSVDRSIRRARPRNDLQIDPAELKRHAVERAQLNLGRSAGARRAHLEGTIQRVLYAESPVAARAGIAPNIRQGAASATAQKIRFIVHSSFGGEGSHMGDGTSRRNLASV